MLPRTDFRSLARAFSTSNKKLRGWPPPPGDPEVKFFTQAGSIKFFFLSLLGSSTHLLPIFMTISSSTSEQGRKKIQFQFRFLSRPSELDALFPSVRRFSFSLFLPAREKGVWGGLPLSCFLPRVSCIDRHPSSRSVD